MHFYSFPENAKTKIRVSTLGNSPGRISTMTPEKMEFYRERIHALYKEINDDLNKENEGEKVVELDTSIGRLSRMDAMQSQQMAFELRRRKEQHLLRLDSALARIKKGTYGACGKCQKPINEARLE